MFALEYRKICDARSQDTSMSGDDLTAGEEKVNASERASYGAPSRDVRGCL